MAHHGTMDQVRLDKQCSANHKLAWAQGESMNSVILFVVAMFCGFLAGRVSAKNEPPQLNTAEQKLKEELTVAQNLNESLLVDLQEAKQSLLKLKQAQKK